MSLFKDSFQAFPCWGGLVSTPFPAPLLDLQAETEAISLPLFRSGCDRRGTSALTFGGTCWSIPLCPSGAFAAIFPDSATAVASVCVCGGGGGWGGRRELGLASCAICFQGAGADAAACDTFASELECGAIWPLHVMRVINAPVIGRWRGQLSGRSIQSSYPGESVTKAGAITRHD